MADLQRVPRGRPADLAFLGHRACEADLAILHHGRPVIHMLTADGVGDVVPVSVDRFLKLAVFFVDVRPSRALDLESGGLCGCGAGAECESGGKADGDTHRLSPLLKGALLLPVRCNSESE